MFTDTQTEWPAYCWTRLHFEQQFLKINYFYSLKEKIATQMSYRSYYNVLQFFDKSFLETISGYCVVFCIFLYLFKEYFVLSRLWSVIHPCVKLSLVSGISSDAVKLAFSSTTTPHPKNATVSGGYWQKMLKVRHNKKPSLQVYQWTGSWLVLWYNWNRKYIHGDWRHSITITVVEKKVQLNRF